MTVRPKSRHSSSSPTPPAAPAAGARAAKMKAESRASRPQLLETVSATERVAERESREAVAASVQHFAQSAATLFGDAMKLDFNQDGALDARDEQLAADAGVAFSVDVKLSNGEVAQLSGAERLAHLADVSAHALRTQSLLDDATVLEPAGAALTRSISESWPAFVRNSREVPALVEALEHSNLPAPDGKLHVWVPAADGAALKRLTAEAKKYNAANPGKAPLVVEAFKPGTDWRELDQSKPGILYLPEPFVVPGGRFAEMYGWDSYFIGQGLLASGRPDLARSMVENQVYLVEQYGKIPNSSRSYHLSRGQPPYLPRFALELYEAQPTPANKKLLEKVAHAAERELATVWQAKGQQLESGLARFHDDASGPDLEVERNLTSQGVFSWPDPEADRAARATGWDLSHRFTDHAHLLEAVDLNSQLFAYEKDLAQIYRIIDGDESLGAVKHEVGAKARAEVMQQRLWNEKLGLFVDFDTQTGEPSEYESVATFAPLAAGWATQAQAQRVADNLGLFLERGGLATSSKASREKAGDEALQWDWPNGWAPLQVIAVEGLNRYGFHAQANEVAYRWCAALLEIAGANNGLLPEKLDVQAVTADVAAAEYGNQGADRGSYWTPREENPQGFGWTNASFVKLRQGLPVALREALDAGVKPEELFPAR